MKMAYIRLCILSTLLILTGCRTLMAGDLQCVHYARNKSGIQIVPLDLGFLSLFYRPPLFRLLATFGPVNFVPKFVSDAVLTIPSGERITAILHEPRLVYDQSVVLRRRSWTLPSFLFPARHANESSWHYFRRVTQWRHESNIPQRAYVRIYDAQSAPTAFQQQLSPAGSAADVVEAQPTTRRGKRRHGRQSEAERLH